MRHDDKGCFEQHPCLLFYARCPFDQIFSHPMTIAVQQQPAPLHNTWVIPRRNLHERGGNTSCEAGQASRMPCQNHGTPLYNRVFT